MVVVADLDNELIRAREAVAVIGADAELPDFEVLASRGRRRQHAHRFGVMAAAAAAVVAIVGLGQVLGQPGGAPAPAPAPQPSETATTGTPRAPREPQVVDIAESGPTRVVVIETGRKRELVVTSDGQQTVRRAVPAGTSVVSLGEAQVLVLEGWAAKTLSVVDAAGVEQSVRWDPAARPAAVGEQVLVLPRRGASVFGAIDAVTHVAHPVPGPDNAYELTAADGRLQAVVDAAGQARYVWSDDGGRQWQEGPLSTDGNALWQPVLSAPGEPRQVIEGGDGATLFPYLALHTINGYDDVSVAPYAGRGYLTVSGAFVHDGTTYVVGARWGKGDRALESGVFRVTDAGLTLIGGVPAAIDGYEVTLVSVEHLTARRPVIWVPGFPGTVYRSDDFGASWDEVAVG